MNTKMEINKTLVEVLTNFDFVKILDDNPAKKLVIIQVIRKDNSNNDTQTNRNAVCIFERPHFSLEETKSYLTQENSFEINFHNDIYKKLTIYPNSRFNNISVQLIYPATDAHIAKYTRQQIYFLNESYEDWLNKTSVYLKNNSFDIQWVYNILEHKKESERIVFEDADPETGFILLPDIKWDGKTNESLYLLAIVHKRDITSLRDLNGSHVKMLENLRDKSLATIESKYGLKKSQVKSYLHYQPTFYHLHVHFTHITLQVSDLTERNHQLSHVIENLKLDSDYYRKVSLQFIVKHNDSLYKLYQDRFE